MSSINEITRIDEQIFKMNRDFNRAKTEIEADRALSSFGQKEKINKLWEEREVQRAKLNKERELAVKTAQQSLSYRAFGVNTSTAAERIAIDDFKAKISQEETPDVIRRLKQAEGASARLIAAELYSRGNFEPLRQHSDKLDVAAVNELEEFDTTYGERKSKAADFMRRLVSGMGE